MDAGARAASPLGTPFGFRMRRPVLSSDQDKKVDVLLAPNGRAPLPDCLFDVIPATRTLEHVPNPAFYVAECARQLHSGGTLILTAPMRWRWQVQIGATPWPGSSCENDRNGHLDLCAWAPNHTILFWLL
jgi:SAM-dependent methyltransferase